MNYAGIRGDLVPFVVDRNPNKQGKYMPGSRIPIVDEQRLREARPDYVVILPWNLSAEVMSQLEYVTWGLGRKFLTAVPGLGVAGQNHRRPDSLRVSVVRYRRIRSGHARRSARELCFGSFVKIKPAGGSGDVIIGDRSVINSCCVLYTGNGIVIGNDVAIAANCTFAPVNHGYREKARLIRDQRFRPGKGGIVIEDDVWIGAGCVLLDGAILRRGCVIGAMSLVRGEVPAYSIQAGNPLRQIGTRV